MEQDRSGCPACGAGFRGTRACSRCGADLGPLMTLAACSFRDRRAAREAIGRGDFEASRRLTLRAQRMCATRTGRRLWLLSAWLQGRG